METSNVVDDRNGRYKISVTAPYYTSRYQRSFDLHVSIRNQPIKGSPFRMHARNAKSYPNVNTVDYKLGLLNSPACVAPGHNTVYVTAYQGRHINKWALVGTLAGTMRSIAPLRLMELSVCMPLQLWVAVRYL